LKFLSSGQKMKVTKLARKIPYSTQFFVLIQNLQGVPEITDQKENCISPPYYDQTSWFFFW
jgi:hypothetical protein